MDPRPATAGLETFPPDDEPTDPVMKTTDPVMKTTGHSTRRASPRATRRASP
ncbi:MAG: hypothetical protein ACODAE_02805 [Gemmatimonadota bacterium]